ncbi:MAG: ATP-binding protein [Bacteroidales bacterium]|nr:ATP-binding protein [Bacteroidales bacterium]MDD3665865.1 ATP-binding protein [Bacteroidales bacterium]
MKLSSIQATINQQRERLQAQETGLTRHLMATLPLNLSSHALIISGIRRCGKSTLIRQIIAGCERDYFFVNFDTPKLYNFETTDFELLDLVIKESGAQKLFFDEIQVVNGWELFVRQKLDEGYQVSLTGSNASLLSKELGTKLTGRHITKELYPFSYAEYIQFFQEKAGETSWLAYLKSGGFPEYIQQNNPDILSALLDDIVYRDIAVRHNIRDVRSLKKLLLFLMANTGNLITAKKLTHLLDVKSTSTVLDYLSFFEESYLVGLVPKYSYSYRAQLVNPRKAYVIDNGLITISSPSYTGDWGRKMENAVYVALRQRNKELFYYNEPGGECDFAVFHNNQITELIQVCFELTPENATREEKGLLAAMEFFKLETGTILTLNQTDEIRTKGKKIQVVPAFDYLSRLS